MEEASTKPYEVHLDVFEGPLDLLLHLIKKNKIDICDIPISLITHQYLENLSLMKSLNLTVAGEFLVMAATLTYIKSRLLLPTSVVEEEAEEDDPRAELVRRLVEYNQFKEAAGHLEDREAIWKNIHGKEPSSIIPRDVEESPSLEANLFDLLDALKEVLERSPEAHTLEISLDELSVRDKMNFILEEIEKKDSILFISLFQRDRTRMAIVVTFLALLELVRLGLIKTLQIESFGPIRLIREEGRDNGG